MLATPGSGGTFIAGDRSKNLQRLDFTSAASVLLLTTTRNWTTFRFFEQQCPQ